MWLMKSVLPSLLLREQGGPETTFGLLTEGNKGRQILMLRVVVLILVQLQGAQ